MSNSIILEVRCKMLISGDDNVRLSVYERRAKRDEEVEVEVVVDGFVIIELGRAEMSSMVWYGMVWYGMI